MKRAAYLSLAIMSVLALLVFLWRSPHPPADVGAYIEDGGIGEAISVVKRPALENQLTHGRCQTAYRLTSIIYPESPVFHYVPKPGDLAAWKSLMQDAKAGAYARQCAAYFLLASDPDARAFLTAEVRDKDPRRRFNAACVLHQFMDKRPTPDDSPHPPRWSIDLAIALLADGSLNEVADSAMGSGRPEGDDSDIVGSPIDAICTMLGWIREPKAVPVLIGLLERDPKNASAAFALGEIGDPTAIPVLIRTLQKGGYDYSEARALGHLKSREAVPLLTEHLNRPKRDFSGMDVMDDETILEALCDIGDKSAIPHIKTYLAAATKPGKVAAASRVLALLELEDPVPRLLELLRQEAGEHEKIRLLWDLSRYRDERVIRELTSLARTSDLATLRDHAAQGLAAQGSTGAAKELALLLKVEFPNLPVIPLDQRSNPPDFNRDMHDDIARRLRSITGQDFGQDATLWLDWLDHHPLPARP